MHRKNTAAQVLSVGLAWAWHAYTVSLYQSLHILTPSINFDYAPEYRAYCIKSSVYEGSWHLQILFSRHTLYRLKASCRGTAQLDPCRYKTTPSHTRPHRSHRCASACFFAPEEGDEPKVGEKKRKDTPRAPKAAIEQQQQVHPGLDLGRLDLSVAQAGAHRVAA